MKNKIFKEVFKYECKKNTIIRKTRIIRRKKFVDYAGWLLPVKYEGLALEHHAVRNNAGLFDVSHMGEVTVKGKDAFDFANHLITNDLTTIGDGQVIYSLLCNEN